MPKSKRTTKKGTKPVEVKPTEDTVVTQEIQETIHPDQLESDETVIPEETITGAAEPVEETSTNNEALTEDSKDNTVKTSVYLQYAGNEYDQNALIDAIKNAWAEESHDVSEIDSMDIYIKPDEFCAYYVINGTDQGNITL